MNGDAFLLSPRKDFCQSPLKERLCDMRVSAGAVFPTFATMSGIQHRMGYSGFPATSWASGATGLTAWNKGGAAEWSANATNTPLGTLDPNGVASVFLPGQNPADPWDVNRYLQVATYHDWTIVIDSSGATQQPWAKATLKIDKRNGLIYDALFEWSDAFWQGSTIPGGSAHYTCGDDGIVGASGAPITNYYAVINTNGAGLDWFNHEGEGGVTGEQCSATVNATHAERHCTGTSGDGSIAFSENWTVDLSSLSSVADAMADALALMAKVGKFQAFYPLYDSGTGATTNTQFTWGCAWYSQYSRSFPISAPITAGTPYGIAIEKATKAIYCDNVTGVHGGEDAIQKTVWVLNPIKKRVCKSAAEWALPSANTDPSGDNSTPGGPTGNVGPTRLREDGNLLFTFKPGEIPFAYGEGSLWIEDAFTGGNVSEWPACCGI